MLFKILLPSSKIFEKAIFQASYKINQENKNIQKFYKWYKQQQICNLLNKPTTSLFRQVWEAVAFTDDWCKIIISLSGIARVERGGVESENFHFWNVGSPLMYLLAPNELRQE